MWNFTNIWQYWDFTGTLNWLASTWVYYSWIVGTISPTIDFMYHQVLLNPMFLGLILVVLVLSVFTFSD